MGVAEDACIREARRVYAARKKREKRTLGGSHLRRQPIFWVRLQSERKLRKKNRYNMFFFIREKMKKKI